MGKFFTVMIFHTFQKTIYKNININIFYNRFVVKDILNEDIYTFASTFI